MDHIAEHGVGPQEAEEVVRSAKRPYPRHQGNEKYRVRGQTASGQYLQVIYLIDPGKTLYVIHARPLTINEMRQFRRERR